MKPKSRFSPRLSSIIITLASAGIWSAGTARAADFTWDGGGTDDLWGTGANWSGDSAPSPGSDNNLIFSGSTRLTPQNNYGDGDDFKDITFDSLAGPFTIGNTGNTGIDWFGNINNYSGNTQTIGFRLYQSASNAINATAGNITLNSSALLFRNGQALTLNAASGKTIQIDSVIADGGGGAGSAIVVNGAGTVILAGENTFTSGMSISSGTVSLTGALASSSLAMGGATFSYDKAGTNTQTLSTTTIGVGASSIRNTVATNTLNLGALTQTAGSGGTVNFATTGVINTATTNTNGILGGWATVGNAVSSNATGDWAAVDGSGNIITYTGYTDVTGNQTGAGASAQNWRTSVGGVTTLTSSATINSLVMRGDFSISNGQTLTIGSGGLMLRGISRWLLNNGAGNTSGTGALTSGLASGELFIHTPNGGSDGNNWRIWTAIKDNGATAVKLVKDGPGYVMLQNANTYTGGTVISGGRLAIGGTAAANSAGLGTGSVTVNSGAVLETGANVSSNTNVVTIANNITLAGGAIYANDGWQTLGGTLDVTTSGILGSTYNSGANTAGEGAKGLAITGLVTGSGPLTIQHSRFNTNNHYNTSFVRFSNNSNTYSGTITVNQNTTASEGGVYLGVNGTTALQHATVNIVSPLAGTNLKFGTSPIVFNTGLGSATIGAISGSAPIVLTGYNQQTHAYTGDAIALTLGGNHASTTLSGVISGLGSLTKSGTGTLTLSAANTFTGYTKVSAGTLALGNALALQNSAFDPSGAGSLDVTGITTPTFGGLTGSSNLAPAVTGYGAVTNLTLNPSTGTATYSGVIADGAAGMTLTKTGAGTQILSGANSYTGATNINSGTLNLGHADALGGGGNITFGGGTLQFSSGNTVDYSGRVANSGSAVIIDTNGQTVTFGSALAASNTGGLTKSGSGSLILTANNTYGGATTVSGGTLRFDGSSSVSANSNLVLGNGSTLALRSDTAATFTPATVSSVTTTIGSGATVNINVDRLSTGISQVLTLGGTTVFSGTNTLNVSGGNGYVLRLNAVGSQGNENTHTFNVASGNTLQVGNITGGTGAGEVNGYYQFTGAGDTVIDGAITMATANRGLGLIFNQTGTVTLSGTGTNLRNNTNNGTDKGVALNNGTLNFNSNDAIRSTQAVTFNINGGTVDNTSGSAVTLTRNGTTNINGNFTFGGTTSLNLGNNAFTLGTASGTTRTITTNGAATLTVGGAIANGTTANSLTKAGTGTLTLAGANTYSGATTIDGGTLTLAATGSIDNTSGVSLGTGGTFDVSARSGYTVSHLTGSGNVTGTLTVSTQLAIGNSPGTVSFSDNLTLGASAVFSYELVGGDIIADLGIISGDLILDDGAILDLVQLGDYTIGDKFTLFSYTGALSGTFAGLGDEDSFTGAGGEWRINYDDASAGVNGGTMPGGSYVTITAVPEPAAALLGGLGMLVLLRRRRN